MNIAGTRSSKDVQKLHDTGFGQSVKGFRTAGAAMEFLSKWRNLSVDKIRELYPAQTNGKTDTEVEFIRDQVFKDIRRKGVKGLEDALGGGTKSLQRILRAGADVAGAKAASGKVGVGGGVVIAGNLLLAVMLDIYIFGTGPTGVPDWKSFIAHRQVKAEYYHWEKSLD